MAEERRLLCLHVEGNPHPPTQSVTVPCSICGTLLWRSLGSLSMPMAAICIDCIDPGDVPCFTMAQVVEWASHNDGDPLAMADDLRRQGFVEKTS